MDARRRERWAVATVSASAFFLLGGYELVRSPSNTLFQAAYGARNLPWVMAVMPLGTFAMLYLYGAALSVLGPRRTLAATSLACGGLIAGCYAAISAGYPAATAVLYVVREAYIVLLIEQYWSFIDSTLDEAGGRKWNGAISGFGSLGGVLGGFLVSKLSAGMGTAALLLLGAASVVPAALLSDLAFSKCGEPPPQRDEGRSGGDHLGVKAFRSTPLLVWIFLLVMLTQVVSTVLSLSFQTYLETEFAHTDEQTAFSGGFYGLLAGVAGFMQFVGTPALLLFARAGTAQLAIPLVHVAAAAVLMAFPSLWTAAAAFFLFKTLDYSVFRATKEILYIPLPFDARYRAKEAIDVFGYRLSKGGTSVVILLFQRLGAAAGFLFPAMSLAGALLWLGCVVPIARATRAGAALPAGST